MSETTPNLRLPYIQSAQAQKHVTHNEAIRALDALVQISVASRVVASPPATPADGVRYIVPSGAAGAWTGFAPHIAAWQDGAWAKYAAREGWLVWVEDEDRLCAFDGSAWTAADAQALNPTPHVGVNTTADDTNRLAVKSSASLFSHDGSDHRTKISKATAADTASQLFQTNFSGRAEVGLTGDDNLHVKVSADGAAWKEAMVVDRSTGSVSFPFTTFGGAVSNPWVGRRWSALGTSITSQGLYTDPLAALLGATLTNLGASGGHLSVPSSGGSGLEIYNAITSIPSDADLVTLEVSINDFGRASSLGTIGDATTSTFYGALLKAGQDILAANPQRVLVYITAYAISSTGYPSGANWNTPNANGNTLVQFQQAVRDVAHRLGCPVIDMAESNISAQTASVYLSDGLHVNTMGGVRMAQFIYDRLLLVRPITLAVATPTFSPAAGSYTGAQSVSMACATSGVTIHYTTDGSNPTTASTVYSGAISVVASATLKALAVKAGMIDSAIGSAAYVISTTVATPTFSPAAGTYGSTQSVTITCATSGATIYYTTNGTTPTTSSTVYSGAISVTVDTTIKALAVKSGLTDSAIGSAAYVIMSQVATPTFSPAAGTYSSTQSVTISCATSGATIHYTTDGSSPTTGSTAYSGAISVAASTTLKALAVKSGMTDSAIASAAYTISASFDPSSLSPALWYDASDLATMFLDTGAATAISTDGQAVARINDKSGNARHATQATSGDRPLYKTDGTYRWLDFDGAGDALAMATRYGTPAGSFALAWVSRKADTSGNGSVITGTYATPYNSWAGDNVLGGGQPNFQVSDVTGATAASSAGGFSSGTVTSDHVAIVNVNAGAVAHYQNGVAGNTGSVNAAYIFNTWGLGFDLATYQYKGRIYELVIIPRALTSGEIADLTTWMKAKAGI